MPDSTHLNKSPSQQNRFYALDATRAIALLLGIFYHSIESFVTYTAHDAYATQDIKSSSILDFTFYALHAFRMQAFFLLAGFFAHHLYRRRGILGFLSHRLTRILLPLIVFWPIMYFFIKADWVWGHQRQGYHDLLPTNETTSIWSVVANDLISFRWFSANGLTVPLFHLWFLYYLALFYSCVVLIKPMIDQFVDRSGRLRQRIDHLLRLVMSKWWSGLLLGVLIAIPMCRMQLLFGIDIPNQNLIINTRPFVVYGLFFLVGWFFNRQTDLLQWLSKYRLSNLLISLLLVIGLYNYFISHLSINTFTYSNGLNLDVYLYKALYGIASIVAVFALIGFMIAFFPTHNTRINYIAEASYWMYLVHFPVVVALQILVSSLFWPWMIKVAVIVLSTVCILLVSYHYCVRTTWIGVLLNGRKHRK